MTADPIDFRAVQDHFGLTQAAAVEKDWHVLRAMRAIISVDARPFRLVFAGGTALARAHKLLQRMSEDVDFKVVPLAAAPVSANKRRAMLGELRDRITASLQAAGFPLDPKNEQQVRSRDANAYTVFQLNYAPQDAIGIQLRPTLQIELSATVLRLPSVRLAVASFVAEANKRDPEIPSIDCVSVTETAAEKLVALTRRSAMALAGASPTFDETLVRHIYDLHMIQSHIDLPKAIELAREIAMQDAEQFRNQYPAYHADVAGESRKGIEVWGQPHAGRDLYFNFVAAMVYGEAAAFNDAIATVRGMVDAAWPVR